METKATSMKVNIETTADGSQTLFVPSLDEHYHSVKGALTESMHIFIKMGLNESKALQPRILEIGFGTGLNALLTLCEADKGRKVRYTSLERYPLPREIIGQMSYPQMTPTDTTKEYQSIHDAKWNDWVSISQFFELRKIETDFTTTAIKEKYDVIYFDAFAPEKQPEMWTQEIFNKMYGCLENEGILVTYCAKGVVRRMLQGAGFTVERLAGPPGGKREILRARKCQ